jgi:imidazole glycerol-phosphate synthase subunit HisH
MITIIGYGLGNVSAFASMYKRMNIDVRVAETAADLTGATRLILPGVGSFDHAMNLFNASGMRGPAEELILGAGVPVLGVCVGMQILAERSDEGVEPGLGWIPGSVRLMADAQGRNDLPMPHMGWNDVCPTATAGPSISLFAGLETDARFYFLHSYFFDPTLPETVAATAGYGGQFACAVSRGNVHGVQFHPEKSHHWGAALLKNFAGV